MQNTNGLCVSIFQNGAEQITREAYTAVWLAYINQAEKRKEMAYGEPLVK